MAIPLEADRPEEGGQQQFSADQSGGDAIFQIAGDESQAWRSCQRFTVSDPKSCRYEPGRTTGYRLRLISCTSELSPDPFGPRSAVCSPQRRCRLRSSKTRYPSIHASTACRSSQMDPLALVERLGIAAFSDLLLRSW